MSKSKSKTLLELRLGFSITEKIDLSFININGTILNPFLVYYKC